MKRTHLGWLGPTIVVVGVVVAALGVWWMSHARPIPGAYVDVLALDDDWAVTVRKQQNGTRNFVELLDVHHGARWQALVPPYAGTPEAPGLAASPLAITVRVIRDEHAELFALGTDNAVKIRSEQLTDAWLPSKLGYSRPHVTTVRAADKTQAFELVGDEQHGSVIAIALTNGTPRWKHDVQGRIDFAAEIVRGVPQLAIVVDDKVQLLDEATGKLVEAGSSPLPLPSAGQIAPAMTSSLYSLSIDATTALIFDPATKIAKISGSAPLVAIHWPDGAALPRAQHLANKSLWLVFADRIVTLDARTLTFVASSDGKPIAIEKAP